MTQLLNLLKKHYTNELVHKAMFFNTIFGHHKYCVTEARRYKERKRPTPIKLISRGIELRLQLIKLTDELLDSVMGMTAIADTNQWGICHSRERYIKDLMTDAMKLRYCANLCKEIVKFPEKTKEEAAC